MLSLLEFLAATTPVCCLWRETQVASCALVSRASLGRRRDRFIVNIDKLSLFDRVSGGDGAAFRDDQRILLIVYPAIARIAPINV